MTKITGRDEQFLKQSAFFSKTRIIRLFFVYASFQKKAHFNDKSLNLGCKIIEPSLTGNESGFYFVWGKTQSNYISL